MTEHQIQRAFIEWFRLSFSDCFVFAIPNGSLRNKMVAIKLKREGVVAGIPDLQVLLPNSEHFFIEMKRPDGKLIKSQKETFEVIKGKGHKVIVCYGLDDAMSKTAHTIREMMK